jgi:hypothetical protein
LSRQRSGRGASTGGSRPSARPAAGGARGVYVQAPKSDIYVALLGIALGAMILGCLLLLIVLGRYEFKLSVAARDTTPVARLALADTGPILKIETVRL